MNSKFPPLLILKSYVLSSYTANISACKMTSASCSKSE